MGGERYGSAIHSLSIQFSRSRHINPYSSRGGGRVDVLPKLTFSIEYGKRKVADLFGKKNGLVRFRKERSTDEGAETREDHHDPEYPTPPKMTNSNAAEKNYQIYVLPLPLSRLTSFR